MTVLYVFISKLPRRFGKIVMIIGIALDLAIAKQVGVYSEPLLLLLHCLFPDGHVFDMIPYFPIHLAEQI